MRKGEARHLATGQYQTRNLALNDGQTGLWGNRCLNGLGKTHAVCLNARAAHCRALGAVEHPIMDRGGVGGLCHHAVESIDLAHDMALADPADRGVAGHGADGLSRECDQGHIRATAGGDRCRLHAGVTATDNQDIEMLHDGPRLGVRHHLVKVFHVEHSLADAELAEQCIQHVVGRPSTGNLVEPVSRAPKFLRDDQLVRMQRGCV